MESENSAQNIKDIRNATTNAKKNTGQFVHLEKNTECNLNVYENKEKILNNSFEENYFIKTIKKNLLIIIILLVVLIVFIICEIFFRGSLYDRSLDDEEKLQNKMSDGGIKFFKFVTHLGGEYLVAVIVIIILRFFTIVQAVVFIFGLVFAFYIHSLMKIWYGNFRPFWERQNLYQGVCDGGFGNPSGHSTISFYMYFSFLYYITQIKCVREKLWLIIILLIVFILWVFLIVFSRIVMGMHSINQVMYGSFLGLWIFLFIFIGLELDKMPISAYKLLYRNKPCIITFTSILIFLIILAIISYFACNRDYDLDELEQLINVHCSGVHKYRRLNKEGLFGSLVILVICGGYLGQFLFWDLVDKEYKDNYNEKNPVNQKIDELINNWNKNGQKSEKLWLEILKKIGVLIICLLPGILFLVIPSDSNLALVFIFKLSFPFFIISFLLFGVGYYLYIKIHCGGRETLLKKVINNPNTGDLNKINITK